jgi:D-galactarolactone cycloisomerase
MKITNVEPIHISVPYTFGGTPRADGIPWRNMETLLVKVTTDEGVTGWGEAFGFGACALTKVAVANAVAPLAVGREPGNAAALTTDLQRKLHNYGRNGPASFAISGFDIALWDIAGQVAGQPLYRMLDGRPLDRIPAYASLLRYGDEELVARHAAEAIEQGYTRVKLHEIGLAEITAGRKAVGPKVDLMVDCNCPWDADEAVAMAERLAPLNLLWLEEPVWPPENYEALARVRREGRVPVAAGENAGTFADIEQLIDTARVDYLQPSVTKVGGVSEMRRIIALSAARRVKLAPHSPYFGPGLVATVHICASLPTHPPVERFYCKLEADPLGELTNVSDGHMTVPTGPGLGLTIDDEVIAKYRVG